MRVARRTALLVALWLLAWGELSLANVLSGIAVATVLLVVFPLEVADATPRRIRVGGALRLAGYVVSQLVLSNLAMARSILAPRPTSRSGVVTHELERSSDVVVTLMTSIIALSPGTMTVDVEGTSTIHVHFFSLDDVDEARGVLARLERLVTGAIDQGSPA